MKPARKFDKGHQAEIEAAHHLISRIIREVNGSGKPLSLVQVEPYTTQVNKECSASVLRRLLVFLKGQLTQLHKPMVDCVEYPDIT